MCNKTDRHEVTEYRLEEGLPLEEVERRLGLAYATAGLKHRVVAFYLAEIDARGLHHLAGCRSTPQYAAARFGMSRREAHDLLVAGKALRELTLIDQAFCEGKLCWSKVRELIKVATPPHQERWIRTAQMMHIDELALEVRLAGPGNPPRDRDDRKGLPEIRLRLNTMLPPDVYAKWEQAKRKIQDESGGTLAEWECFEAMCDLTLLTREDGTVPGKTRVIDSPYCVLINYEGDSGATVETDLGILPVDPVTAETIACGCCHVDAKHVDRKADRDIPQPLRRRVMAHWGGRCACCRSRHRVQVHHVIWVSRGGKTEFENLVPLCRRCHSLVHGGLLVIEGAFPEWRFVDKESREVNGASPPPGEMMAKMAGEIVTLDVRKARPVLDEPPADRIERTADIPGEIDPAWWRRHAHLLSYNASTRTFNVRPGRPLGADPGVGTMCQFPSRGRPRPAGEGHGPGLEGLVGQPDVLGSLKLAVRVARKRNEPLGHTLLVGGPGLGKTTIAKAVANDLGGRLHASSATTLNDPSVLLRTLAGLGPRDVAFIDEVHALPIAVALFLYEALAEGSLSLPLTCGAEARTVTMRLAPFTFIGATTDEGQLPDAFLSRFKHEHRLSFYDHAELAEIIRRGAKQLEVGIDDEAAAMLASAARQTPRLAHRLLEETALEAEGAGSPAIDSAIVMATLGRLRIDEQGLGPVEREYLDALRLLGPIGIGRFSATLGVPETTLQTRHEPYLFRLGLATTTPAGRMALTPRLKLAR